MARIMAIDFGQKRCGIAVTDEMQLICSPLTTVASAQIMEFILEFVKKESLELIVVGLPTDMKGNPSESEKFIGPFLHQLHRRLPAIPIERQDERFTSKMAFQTMIDSGISKSERRNKANVDMISAAIILQSYMDRVRFQKQ